VQTGVFYDEDDVDGVTAGTEAEVSDKSALVHLVGDTYSSLRPITIVLRLHKRHPRNDPLPTHTQAPSQNDQTPPLLPSINLLKPNSTESTDLQPRSPKIQEDSDVKQSWSSIHGVRDVQSVVFPTVKAATHIEHTHVQAPHTLPPTERTF
jgi:hypothetical protein